MAKQKDSIKKTHHAGRLQHWQLITIILVIYDIFASTLPYFLALWLRFDCRFSQVPDYYFYAWLKFAPFYAVICIIVYALLKLYRSIWRFASFYELFLCLIVTVITGVVHVAGTVAFVIRMPVSYYCIGILLQFLLVVGVRFAYRFILLLRRKQDHARTGKLSRVMIVGAGNAGRIVLRDVQKSSELNEKVFCIIDDNKNKWGRYIDGVPIVGGRDDIPENAIRYGIDKIYIAIADITAKDKSDIILICAQTGCEIKKLPGLYQLASGEVSLKEMRDISVEDLLGREPVETDLDSVFGFISGKRILVTGGGGSIGSELCRQIAAHRPEKLIIFDVYENNAYAIQLELKKKYPDLDLVVLIGSVRDSRRIMQVFSDYKPHIVYHAAAHKHVPLMEDSPCESIKNNVIGTYKTAYAAMVNNTERFILISTDKAVNPTNIMGASKRLCEMVIQLFDNMIRSGKACELPNLFVHKAGAPDSVSSDPVTAKTEYAAVRFGNVLGSNGSVVNVFKNQIEAGGPVTVTHPDIVRYFMTIPEAVSLVLVAGTYARGGEIFVLDMGEPVKIDDLARNMIRLSGFIPDVDIAIEYTGLRPGEKLYEERLMAEEGLKSTANNKILIGDPVETDHDKFLTDLKELMDAAYDNSPDIEEMVAKMVPTYRPRRKDLQQP